MDTTASDTLIRTHLDFLRRHAPFDRMEPNALRFLGERLSTAFYDFDDVADEVATSGTWGGDLAFDLALARTSPTNPFRHKYHPEHDDAAGDPPESFAITRHIALVFAAADPEDADAPDWGTKRVAGTYSETIEGLHSDLIRVGGTFTLNRYSNDGVLNPAVP